MDSTNPIDPYRPPQASGEPSTSGTGPGAPLEWSPVEAFTFAWETLRAHPMCVLVALVATLVTQVIGGIAQVIQIPLQAQAQRTGNEDLYVIVVVIAVGSVLLNLPIAAWMALGQARYALQLARGKRPAFSVLFEGRNLLTALGAMLITALATVLILVCTMLVPVLMLVQDRESELGFALVLVATLVALPAILFVAVRVCLSTMAAADGVVGPINALGRSWSCTRGQFWLFVLYFVLVFAIAIAALVLGLIACCIGVLVTMPAIAAMIQISTAYAYLKRTGVEPVLLQRAA